MKYFRTFVPLIWLELFMRILYIHFFNLSTMDIQNTHRIKTINNLINNELE